MGLALYRKYRPQLFGEVIGQDHIKITLAQEVAKGTVAHAYLFSGARGVGKTSLARILAKAVNCEKRAKNSGEPCTACSACAEILSGRSLDVIEIDAASHTGVDTVRETIVETAKFAPARLHYKVFIIDEAHMLSTAAWNALLKIMEEPPAHVIFILATTEVHKVPATIMSRCQRFDFHRITVKELTARLESILLKEKVKVPEVIIKRIARLAEGCVRDAESIMEQVLSVGGKEVTVKEAELVLPQTSAAAVLSLLEALGAYDVKKGIALIGEYTDQGFDLPHLTNDLLEYVRYMLVIKTAGSELVQEYLDEESLRVVGVLAAEASIPRMLRLVELFSRARQAFKMIAIPQLPLEIAVIEGCERGEGAGEKSVGQGDGDSLRLRGSRSPASPRSDSSPVATAEGNGGSLSSPLGQSSATILARTIPLPDTRGNEKKDFTKERISVNSVKSVSVEELKEKWAEVLKRAQEENHSLPFLLSTSEPMRVEGNKVQIGVQYPFHCDKLNEPKCRAVLEKVLTEVYQTQLHAVGVVRAIAPIDNSAVDDILNTLGGRVVE